MEGYIAMDGVRKTYRLGDVEIHALNGVSFTVGEGEFVVVTGASGAGKSTLLNILGGMDTATSGSFSVAGREIGRLDRRQLTEYRRNDIGFVFQFYNLVPNLNALENVELAAEICREPSDARAILEQVGLGERLRNFPAQLSGGEQQRVAIARALAKNPRLLLCDEPTGALDDTTGKAILALLLDMCRAHGRTVVVVTHNHAIAAMGDRVVRMRNGTVEDVVLNPHPVPVDRIEW